MLSYGFFFIYDTVCNTVAWFLIFTDYFSHFQK